MEVSTYEVWLEEDRQDRERLAAIHPEYVQSRLTSQEERDRDRRGLLVNFPYSVVAEGEYSDHDYAARWCWQHIGRMNGLCIGAHTYYPACPLVLETEYLERGEYQGQETVEKRYRHPADHEHQGQWTYLWFGKTGYDYGFGEYYFVNETDCTQFLAALPTFNWDASWDEEEPT
jgi:hypothetical protein